MEEIQNEVLEKNPNQMKINPKWGKNEFLRL